MEKETKQIGKKREIEGTVISNKMEKTVRVKVDIVYGHPVYSKVMKKEKTYFAHTENPLNIGDKVCIRECKPYAKNVKWVVINKE